MKVMIASADKAYLDTMRRRFTSDARFGANDTFTGSSVKDACALAIARAPELCLCDISSFGADALFLVSEIKRTLPSAGIIASADGFGDLKQLQSRISVKIEEFVLKRGADADFESALARYIEDVERRNARREPISALMSQIESERPYLLTQFIGGIMDGTLSEEQELNRDASFLSDRLLPDGEYMLALFQPLAPEPDANKDYLRMFELRNRMRELMRPVNCVSYIDSLRRGVMLINLAPWRALDKRMYLVEYSLKSLSAAFLSDTGCALAIGASAPVSGLKRLPVACRQAEQALIWAFRQEEPFPLTFFADLDAKEPAAFMSHRLRDRVLSAVLAADARAVEDALRKHYARLIDIMEDTESAETRLRSDLCALLIHTATDLLTALTGELAGELMHYTPSGDAESMIDSFRERVMRLATARQSAAGGHEHLIITRAKQLIAQEAPHRFSTQEMAARMNVSTNYFSSLFKKHESVGFIEYQSLFALSRAIELMQNPRLRISEISAIVGYDDANYFSRQFKRRYGANPTVYRNSAFNLYVDDPALD